MKFTKIVTCLSFLSVLLIVTSYAQVTSDVQIDLSINNVTFPDTVQIGETVVLEGFIKNESDIVFESNILLNYDIEDIEPEDYEEDEETDEEEMLENVQLQPGETVAFSRSLQINSARFVSNSQNIVIVWPEVSRIIDSNTANNYGVKEVFVKEAALNNEEEVDNEEDDENEEEEEEDENEEEEDDDDEEEDDDNENNKTQNSNPQIINNQKGNDILLNKNNNYRLNPNTISTEIQILQQNEQLKISVNNPEIEVLNFSLFTSNGQILFEGKTYEYNVNNKMDILPLISMVNYRLKSSPNKVNTFTKSIILK